MEVLFSTANIFNDIAAVLLFGSGIYLTVRFGFFQFKGLGKIISKTVGGMFGKNRDMNAFRLFSTSLAGAAGVGNITGVAAAIAMGGPGAVFWMWVAAFLGMATKYAETLLSVKFKSSKNGYNSSPMEYIKRASGGEMMPCIFSFFGIAVSLLMGDLIQSRAACEAIREATGISENISGPLICMVISTVIFGGFSRIGKVMEKAVPIMTVMYIAMCGAVIVIYKENIISAFRYIFVFAVQPMAAAGGFVGSTVASAIRCGVSKGIFSNEAGLGSAGLAYGNAETGSPEDQALWGAFDVFADTIIISSFTALAILTSGAWRDGEGVIFVFNETMGTVGSVIGAICIALFAVASIITWEYYGETCFAFITKGRYINIFRIIFAVFALVGATVRAEILWPLSEIANTLMMSVNMFGVLKLDVKQKK